MKLFIIEFNENGYDQYDSFIVRANNEDEVVKILKKVHKNDYNGIDWEGGFTVKEIHLEGEPKILLGSFNAG